MKILDDLPHRGDSRAFAVELELGDEPGDAAAREQWASVPDEHGYGVPHALVLYGDGKVDPSALRAALVRFNVPPDDGWRWTVEALAMHLLDDLCGITLADCRSPPPAGEPPENEVP